MLSARWVTSYGIKLSVQMILKRNHSTMPTSALSCWEWLIALSYDSLLSISISFFPICHYLLLSISISFFPIYHYISLSISISFFTIYHYLLLSISLFTVYCYLSLSSLSIAIYLFLFLHYCHALNIVCFVCFFVLFGQGVI